MELAGVQWALLAQDSNQWRAVVNAVKNKVPPKNACKIFGSLNNSSPFERVCPSWNFLNNI
jgi:hypothetical protein